MPRKISYCLAIVVCLVLAFVSADSGAAQSTETFPDDLLVNYIETSEDEESLHLDLYFTVLDEDGSVLSNYDVDSADIIIDGTRYEAQVSQPTTPLFIALALDLSGSMLPSLNAMKLAAIEAIENSPPQAEIAIVTFNESIEEVKFTASRAEAIATVAALDIDARLGTCLFDAAHASVQLVNGASADALLARRAVILFTDGRDVINIEEPDVPCSTRTFSDVVELANESDSPVSIHTIGLGDVEPRLPALAQETGGINSVSASGDDLAPAFAEVMSGLSSQWIAQADVVPTAGQQTATIEIQGADNSIISQSVEIDVERDYIVSEPLRVRRFSLAYNEAADEYSLEVTMLGDTEQINLSRLIVLDENNNEAATFDYRGFEPPFVFDTEQLEEGQSYTVEFIAMSESGEMLQADDGEAVLVSSAFTYELPEPMMEMDEPVEMVDEVILPTVVLQTITMDAAGEQIVVSAELDNTDDIDRYDVEVINLRNGDIVTTLDHDFDTEDTLLIPLTDFVEGDYQLSVSARAEDGAVLASNKRTFNYVAPVSAESVNNVRSSLWQLLLIPLVIIGLATLLVAWFLIRAMLARRNSQQEAERDVLIPPQFSPRPLPAAYASSLGAETVHGDARAERNERYEPVPLVLNIVSTLDTEKQGATISVNRVPFTLGRENCNLTIKNDPHMSRRHAKITATDGQYFVIDLNSSNGVYVEGQRIEPNTPTQIGPGSQFGLGKSTVIAVGEGVFEAAY